jgi:hypothetical protein
MTSYGQMMRNPDAQWEDKWGDYGLAHSR